VSLRPPLLARLLLALGVPAAHREFVTGDLSEALERRAARDGVRAARRWYWREALIAVFTRWPRSPVVSDRPARGDSPVHTLLQDLRFGCRLLWRSPGFTVVAVLTLGLGMGANTTIFSWINSVLLTPIPGASDSGRLVSFSQTFQGSRFSLSYPDYIEYRNATRLLSGIAAREELALHVSVDGVPERAWAELVSANFFDVLGVRPALGRTFLPEEDRTPRGAPAAVISHGFWQRRFGGDPGVVNRRVDINGHPFTIVGVTPHGFQGSMTALAYDVWVPMMMQPVVMPGADRLPQRDNHWLSAFARLAPGATAEQARDEIDAITRQMTADHAADNEIGVSVALLRDSSDGAISVLRPVLLALAMVAALVLIIACANLANLMLARGASRRREIAIRSSMGASRSRIVRQLLTESVLIAAGGAAVALVIARWTAGLLMVFAPPTEFPISLNVPLDARVFAFTGVAGAVTALFFGLVPALQASKADYTPALKVGSQGAGSPRRRLRDALVVAEVSLSLALLVAAGLCVRSVQKARQFDPGFNPQGVLLTSVDLFPSGYTATTGRVFYRQLLDRLEALPGAESVTLARRVPLGFTGNSQMSTAIDGYEPQPGETILVSFNPVGPDYLKTMQIPLISGRDIARTDERGGPYVAVINETMARRYWRDRDPVGGRFRFDGEHDWITVIGVARDVKMRALNEQPRPFAYLPVLQYYHSSTVVHVRTSGDPGGARGAGTPGGAGDRSEPAGVCRADAGRQRRCGDVPAADGGQPAVDLRGPGDRPRGGRPLRRARVHRQPPHAGDWRPNGARSDPVVGVPAGRRPWAAADGHRRRDRHRRCVRHREGALVDSVRRRGARSRHARRRDCHPAALRHGRMPDSRGARDARGSGARAEIRIAKPE
jgi:predicted permease